MRKMLKNLFLSQTGSKSEARNPKFEANGRKIVWGFGHLDFGFVSDFDIRISNLLTTFLVPATPG
jgi:hypothetical protein